MTDRFDLFERDPEKMNIVRLKGLLVGMSDDYSWGGYRPSPEQIELYKRVYEKIMASDDGGAKYAAMGCVRPDRYGAND